MEMENFKSLRNENDEPIYTNNDKHLRWFVRQNIEGGRVCALTNIINRKLGKISLRVYQKK